MIRYAVGLAIPVCRAIDGDRLRLEAMPHLERVANEINERVNLGVMYKDRVLYLAGIEKPVLPSIYSRFGRTVPANCSSLGKAILAQYSQSQLEGFLERSPLVQQTAKSVTDRSKFIEELGRVRKQGYALDIEENALGSVCMAVPILSGGDVVGAISVSARSYDALDGREQILQNAAEQIMHKL